MAKATTEVFAEMVVEFETTGGALPVAQLITSLTAANPSIMTVPTIGAFLLNDVITISGLGGALSAKNGTYKVGIITGSTFPVQANAPGTALDLSAAGALQTQTLQPGMTVQPALGAGLVWSKICGITSRTVNRTTTMQSTEVPDCSDETLPNYIEKSVQSLEETISGTGVWAAESHGTMINWWRSGQRKGIRITNVKAITGTIQTEYGYAYLTQLNNAAVKGAKVTSDIQIEFDGLPLVGFA